MSNSEDVTLQQARDAIIRAIKEAADTAAVTTSNEVAFKAAQAVHELSDGLRALGDLAG